MAIPSEIKAKLINTQTTPVKIKGKEVPSYTLWRSICKRCYDTIRLDKYPAYRGCSLHPEWFDYQNFALWYKDNAVDSWSLDKDILVFGNKVYGPDTCVFVPQAINVFCAKATDTGRDLPRGVYKRKNRYTVKTSSDDKSVWVGMYLTVQEAFNAHCEWRLQRTEELINKYPELNTRDNIISYIINTSKKEAEKFKLEFLIDETKYTNKYSV